jgi:hypothetical protein
MANALYGNTLYCDTVGIISKTPITVKAICFYPNQQADAIQFNWWDESNPLAGSNIAFTATASTGTVTNASASADVMTSAAFPDGAVVKVIDSSGAAGNKTYHLIGTAGNDDRFVVTPTALWADEATIYYHVTAYPARAAFQFKQPYDTNELSMWFTFGGDGLRLPNLTLETISSTCSAIVYIA